MVNIGYRTFNGTTDVLDVAMGNLASANNTPETWIFAGRLLLVPSFGGEIVAHSSYVALDWWKDDSGDSRPLLFQDESPSSTSPFNVGTADGFAIYAVTRTAGVAMRWHKAVYSGSWGAFTHQDGVEIANVVAYDSSGTFKFGNNAPLNADFAVVAHCDTALSDAAIDSLTTNLATWQALASLTNLWRFDGVGGTDAVNDLEGTCTQSSITGTTTTANGFPLAETGGTGLATVTVTAYNATLLTTATVVTPRVYNAGNHAPLTDPFLSFRSGSGGTIGVGDVVVSASTGGKEFSETILGRCYAGVATVGVTAFTPRARPDPDVVRVYNKANHVPLTDPMLSFKAGSGAIVVAASTGIGEFSEALIEAWCYAGVATTVTVTAYDATCATNLIWEYPDTATVTATAFNATVSTGGGGTNVDAGLASVTVSAFDAHGTIAAGENLATVTVTGLNASPIYSSNIAAGLASVTVTANNASPIYSSNVAAGVGNIAISALNATPTASSNISAGTASVTVTGSDATDTVRASTSLATVTITGFDAAPTYSSNISAGVASVTVSGFDATCTVNASTTTATVTITAANASPTYSSNVSAGVATVTATAFDSTTTIAGAAALATVTVTASNASPIASSNVSAGVATVTITGSDASPVYSSNVPAGLATVTVTAADATPTASSNVAAGLATVTVIAANATPTASSNIPTGLASVAITAYDAITVNGVFAVAGLATVTATAFDASPIYSSNVAAGLASVTATAYRAGVGAGAGTARVWAYPILDTFTGADDDLVSSLWLPTANTIQGNKLRLTNIQTVLAVAVPADFNMSFDYDISTGSRGPTDFIGYPLYYGGTDQSFADSWEIALFANAITLYRIAGGGGLPEASVFPWGAGNALGDTVHFRVQVAGNTHRLRVWRNADPEPVGWNGWEYEADAGGLERPNGQLWVRVDDADAPNSIVSMSQSAALFADANAGIITAESVLGQEMRFGGSAGIFVLNDGEYCYHDAHGWIPNPGSGIDRSLTVWVAKNAGDGGSNPSGFGYEINEGLSPGAWAGYVLLAEILVPAAATTSDDCTITDHRVNPDQLWVDYLGQAGAGIQFASVPPTIADPGDFGELWLDLTAYGSDPTDGLYRLVTGPDFTWVAVDMTNDTASTPPDLPYGGGITSLVLSELSPTMAGPWAKVNGGSSSVDYLDNFQFGPLLDHVNISCSAGLAAVSAIAYNATVTDSVEATAETAEVAVSALNPHATIAIGVQLAEVVVAAFAATTPTVYVDAGVATVNVTAANVTANVQPTPTVANVYATEDTTGYEFLLLEDGGILLLEDDGYFLLGTTKSATLIIAPVPSTATVTATAYNATTTSVVTDVEVFAGVATAAATAYGATTPVSVSSGLATVGVTGYGATVSVSVFPTLTTVTATASGVTTSISESVPADVATVTATAYGASLLIGSIAYASTATIIASALGATIAVSDEHVSVSAGVATVSPVAYSPSATIGVTPSTGSVTSTGQDARGSISVSVVLAQVVSTAYLVGWSATVNAGGATTNVFAFGGSGSLSLPATTATVTGTALAPLVFIYPSSGLATVTATSHLPRLTGPRRLVATQIIGALEVIKVIGTIEVSALVGTVDTDSVVEAIEPIASIGTVEPVPIVSTLG